MTDETPLEHGIKDIGIGVNTVASRLTSIGIVGVFVVLFCGGCLAFWLLLREAMATNREETKSFLEQLQRERERAEARYEAARTRNDTRHDS